MKKNYILMLLIMLFGFFITGFTSPKQIEKIVAIDQKKKPIIKDIKITPDPYTATEIDKLLDNITILLTVDDPDSRIDEIEVDISFHGFTDRILVAVVEDAACENPLTCIIVMNKEGNAYKSIKGYMVFNRFNTAGETEYILNIPVTKIDFYGSGGYIQEIKFELFLNSQGKNLVSRTETLITTTDLVELIPTYPGTGDVVEQKTEFTWRIEQNFTDSDDRIEVYICKNPELEKKLFRGCKTIIVQNHNQNSLSLSDVPKLSKGDWWWGIKVRRPFYFLIMRLYNTDPYYISPANYFKVQKLSGSGNEITGNVAKGICGWEDAIVGRWANVRTTQTWDIREFYGLGQGYIENSGHTIQYTCNEKGNLYYEDVYPMNTGYREYEVSIKGNNMTLTNVRSENIDNTTGEIDWSDTYPTIYKFERISNE